MGQVKSEILLVSLYTSWHKEEVTDVTPTYGPRCSGTPKRSTNDLTSSISCSGVSSESEQACLSALSYFWGHETSEREGRGGRADSTHRVLLSPAKPVRFRVGQAPDLTTGVPVAPQSGRKVRHVVGKVDHVLIVGAELWGQGVVKGEKKDSPQHQRSRPISESVSLRSRRLLTWEAYVVARSGRGETSDLDGSLPPDEYLEVGSDHLCQRAA